ncbi:MAG: rhomboid family intramembrane serine protease [Hyphomicrobiaceae bacterium]
MVHPLVEAVKRSRRTILSDDTAEFVSARRAHNPVSRIEPAIEAIPMFLPLVDDNKLKDIPFQYVTLLLIAANVAVFILQLSGIDQCMLVSLAVVPGELIGVGVSGGAAVGGCNIYGIPEGATLVTYMFLHGDFAHLLGNMLFLWVFGDNVEDALGHFKFLVFYILCGVCAALAHAAFAGGSDVPLIGASGAVAGVIAAYLMLHPRVRVWVLAFKFIPLQISAAMALGAWVVLQFVMVAMPQVGPVAWWAHIGGLAAGAVLVIFMRRPGVPLFDRGLAV